MNYEPRQFVANTSGGSGVSTVPLRAVNLDASFYEDTGDVVVSGVSRLLTGAKYNVNGTWAATQTPGSFRVVFLCRGPNMNSANGMANTLYDLAGRSGVLYGVDYTGSTVATHTCSAVVVSARPMSMLDRVGAAIGREHAIQVEVVFDRLTKWS